MVAKRATVDAARHANANVVDEDFNRGASPSPGKAAAPSIFTGTNVGSSDASLVEGLVI